MDRVSGVSILSRPSRIPADESYEFLTDVTAHRDGSEYRLRLRQAARHLVSYKIPTGIPQKARSENLFRYGLRDPWLVPVWSDGQQVSTITSGQITIPCNTDHHTLVAGNQVMLSSPGSYQTHVIASVGSGTLDLATPADPISNCTLVPCKSAILIGDPTFNSQGHESVISAQFHLQEEGDILEEVADQYQDHDITHEPGLFSGQSSSTHTIQQLQEIKDYKLGKIAQSSPWERTKNSFSYRRIADGAEEIHNLRRWIFRRAGRNIPFWSPSFHSDFQLSGTGPLGTSFLVANNNFVSNDQHISILDATGTWYDRQITGYTTLSASSAQLEVDAVVPIDAEDVRLICLLSLFRLSSDKITMKHLGGAVSEVVAPVVEVIP